MQVWAPVGAQRVPAGDRVRQVCPDGKETFVQSGWLRTGARKLDREQSTLLEAGAELSARTTRGRFPADAG